jgi:hypothetical protein
LVDAVSVVPTAKLRGVGAGALALGSDGDADGAAGRLVRVGFRGAAAGALAVGRSFNSAVVSTGASCRSRLRLSAVAVSPLSPPPQAATATNISAAIIVLDIKSLLGSDLLGF